MKSIIITFLLGMGLLTSIKAQAQEQVPTEQNWAIEVDAIQPFIPEVGIITIQAMRHLNGTPNGVRGELLLGAFIRPNISHDVVKTINEYTLRVGYRQYLWNQLSVEAQVLGGYVWGKENKVDKKDYEGAVYFIEFNSGYKINFGSNSRWYVLPQFGYLIGLNPELIIGPRNGKSDQFIQGKLNFGFAF